MRKGFKMGFIEEVEPLKLTTIPKKYQKVFEERERFWFERLKEIDKDIESSKRTFILTANETLKKQAERYLKKIKELEHRLSNSIEPKFKVGQKVWVVDNLAEEIYVGKVVFIEAQKYKDEGENIIWYQVEYFDECTMSGPFEESFTFATEEEAKAKLEDMKK